MALSTRASGQGSLNFSKISFSNDPAFTPTLIEQLKSFAALIISFIFLISPMFPGLILKQLHHLLQLLLLFCNENEYQLLMEY